MRNKAGVYNERLHWMKRSNTKDNIGQDVASYTHDGYLWANVEPETGRRQDDYGADQAGQNGTIRIRNYPTVSALDRLYRPEWEQTWIIDSIVYGEDEIIVAAHVYESLDV
jgi:head-tail adaptor